MNMLPYARFQPAALREVRPAGWLQDFLERQAKGLTGNVAVSGYPYGYKFWGSQGRQYQRLLRCLVAVRTDGLLDRRGLEMRLSGGRHGAVPAGAGRGGFCRSSTPPRMALSGRTACATKTAGRTPSSSAPCWRNTKSAATRATSTRSSATTGRRPTRWVGTAM